MKVAVFCSNPVNGGTVDVFVQSTKELMERELDIEFIPVVNSGNHVAGFDLLPNLVRMDVLSEVQTLGEVSNARLVKRVLRRFQRNRAYNKQKKKNICIMKQFLQKHDIETVLIHNGGYLGDDLCNQMLQAAYEIGIKKRIMVFHSDFKKSLFRKILCIPYDLKINKHATRTVTVSKFTKNRLLNSSLLNKNMEVIYNGITFSDSEGIEEKKQRVLYKENYLHIGMVGNFQSNKGQLDFLKAVKRINDSLPMKLQVFIIGNVYDKEYYETCKTFIADNNLTDVVSIIHGILNAKEYFCLFDVTVVPSLYDESFGLISLESMRASVPVVAYACGGIPEVVKNGIDGYIVPVGDWVKLGEKIVELIKDSSKRDIFGNNARNSYLNNFSRKQMGDRYLKVIGD